MLLPRQPMSQGPLFLCSSPIVTLTTTALCPSKKKSRILIQALPLSAHAQEQLRSCPVGPISEGGALATWFGDVISGRRE